MQSEMQEIAAIQHGDDRHAGGRMPWLSSSTFWCMASSVGWVPGLDCVEWDQSLRLLKRKQVFKKLFHVF